MGYALKTKKGYDFFEVSSALQKSIRRGLEDEAMYWAAEFYHSGFDEYLWKRLRVCCSEDIGIAEPALPATIHALYSTYQDFKKKKKEDSQPSERLFLAQAVITLCRAQKSRLICHASIHYFRTHEHYHLPIPDYAYDQHTRKGKSMKRGLAHFFEEGARLENMAEVDREEEYLERAKKALVNPGADLFASE
ncbi:AAA family ATPase [Pontibacter mangrovi]|uniref:MgsA AAA+ ATPase C-terminal domain-containing protein n=1 Tax=Pontibacter mangrovi TaxID=2589816 RepID=A0A501WAZ1_9BACT|nr:hypothetical protein [Pontibacter mangrovi]TPE43977.1 hypothetical protein FJM65_11165 [Pontibacter mangrovi]